MLKLEITNEQKVKVTLTPVTDTGKPAKLDGAPTWSVLAGDSTVEPSEDGLSADLVSADAAGQTDILVSADADLGSGVIEIQETIQLSVVNATAKNLGLVAGEPVPK